MRDKVFLRALKNKEEGRFLFQYRLLGRHLSDAENRLSTGPAGTPDSKPTVLQFDLLGRLDLPVLLLLVDTVASDHVCSRLTPHD